MKNKKIHAFLSKIFSLITLSIISIDSYAGEDPLKGVLPNISVTDIILTALALFIFAGLAFHIINVIKRKRDEQTERD